MLDTCAEFQDTQVGQTRQHLYCAQRARSQTRSEMLRVFGEEKITLTIILQDN